MLLNIEIEGLTAAILDDEETIQNSKSESWHGEEVHSHDKFLMIARINSPQSIYASFGGIDAQNP